MCQFVETIRVAQGEARNLRYHEARLNETRRVLWQQQEPVSLLPVMQDFLSGRQAAAGCPTWKVRIVYGREGIAQVTGEPYTMRTIRRLRLIEDNHISYPFKRTDRTALQRLFAERGTADDIIIVRNGLLTDTSFTNIALYDGERWITPREPLLKGTMRASLLDSGIITEGEIAAAALPAYSRIALFNAMIDFGQAVISTADVIRPTEIMANIV